MAQDMAKLYNKIWVQYADSYISCQQLTRALKWLSKSHYLLTIVVHYLAALQI